MDEQNYILDHVWVPESPPTINEYEPYDHDEYVDGTPPNSTNYEPASQAYNESAYQQQYIYVTNNWALSHCNDSNATVVDKLHEIRNIHNHARHIREVELLDTCATLDDVLLSLPEYNPTQVPGQNNNENPFLGFNSKLYSQEPNVVDENPLLNHNNSTEKINVDSGKIIEETDNGTNFCHDNDEFSEEAKFF